MVTVSGHTIDESLLSDGVIIDVGCRYFNFADHFENKKVYCIDPDPDVFTHQKHVNLNVAIASKRGDSFYYRNGEATCLCDIYQPLPHLYTPCKTITMKDLYKITGENVDVLKLDCEGGEYAILTEKFKPIPKQITVEFHNHLVPELHRKKIDLVMYTLSKHYNFVYKHESGMDNLFVRKWN